MCTHITATVNADADREKVQATLGRRRFRFTEVPPPSGIPKGRRYLVHDTGRYDCGTVIGSSFHQDGPAYDSTEIVKFRKSGWSET